MTRYRVEVTEQVFEAIRSHARYIAFVQNAPLNAKRWLESLWDTNDSLEEFPKRCGLAPENNYRPYKIRQRIDGNSVILFTLNEKQRIVYVIGFRHGGQLPNRTGIPEDSGI